MSAILLSPLGGSSSSSSSSSLNREFLPNMSETSWTSLATGSISASASSGINLSSYSAYAYLRISLRSIVFGGAASLSIRASTDSGSTAAYATGYYGSFTNNAAISNNTSGSTTVSNGTEWAAIGTATVGAGITYTTSSYIDIVLIGMNTASSLFRGFTEYNLIQSGAGTGSASTIRRGRSLCSHGTAATHNGILLIPSTSTLTCNYEIFGAN